MVAVVVVVVVVVLVSVFVVVEAHVPHIMVQTCRMYFPTLPWSKQLSACTWLPQIMGSSTP